MLQRAMVFTMQHPFPCSPPDTLRLLAELNLLNAAVKTEWGRECVDYGFIKGHAAALMVHLLRSPQPGVSCYLDLREHVAYYRVCGVQVSFHHIPIIPSLHHLLPEARRHPQSWDKMRLQTIAADFREWAWLVASEMEQLKCSPTLEREPTGQETFRGRFTRGDAWSFLPPMARYLYRPPFDEHVRSPVTEPLEEDRWLSLQVALRFRIWDVKRLRLYSRYTTRQFSLMRFDGANNQQVKDFLRSQGGARHLMLDESLRVGRFYFSDFYGRMHSSSPHIYQFWLSRYPYLFLSGRFFYLGLTYGIALYLAQRFPRVFFVNIFDFRSYNCHRSRQPRTFYTLGQLLLVSPYSRLRERRAFLPIDTSGHLSRFNPSDLPRELIEEYMHAEDI